MLENKTLEMKEYEQIGKSVCCQFALEIYKLKKQNVRFYFFRLPVVHDIKNPSELEKKIIRENINGDNVLDLLTKQELEYVLNNKYSEKYVKGVFRSFKPIVRKNGVLVHSDSTNRYFNIINGIRVTTNNPQDYRNTIYLYGKSQCLGLGVSDDQTISSYLQRNCDDIYCIENHGVGGVSYEEILLHVQKKNYKENDIVIVIQHIEDFMNEYFGELGVNIDNNLFSIMSRPHNMGEIFYDKYHFNYIANQKIAEYIQEVITANMNHHHINMLKVLQNQKDLPALIEKDDQTVDRKQLEQYIQMIKKSVGELKDNIGSIVMNCNPFTLGHRYLVECALEQIDNLIIFVVEENSSFFSFHDRFEMVKNGCADLKNVYVVPSGKFIISAGTFPQYFEKDKLKEVIIDPSGDVSIFGKYIAPALGIKVRFVGNEPFDFVTKQYNDTLISVLPQYGVNCIVIERKKSGNEVISASLVRKYIQSGSIEKLKDFVPDTTLLHCKAKMIIGN